MTLKLIQVGLGAHGKGVGADVVMASEEFEYAGLADLNEQVLKECGEQFGVPEQHLYTSYQKAFQELAADAVLVTAASPIHYEVCKAAIENGLHVLVEKPFVTNLTHGIDLVDLAAARNVRLMVNQNYRFLPAVLTLKQAIDSGSAGKALFVSAQFFYNHDGKNYQRQMEHYMLIEMAIHHIDMMRHLLESNIAGTASKTWNTAPSEYKGDPHVHAVFEMASGVPVFYLGSLLSKGLQTPWEGTWRIQCENGSLHLDDLGEGYGVYLVDPIHGKTKLPLLVPERESIHASLHEFASSIMEDREPQTSGRDNLHTLEALFAAGDSSKSIT